ncbi:MAG TPA: hypothetical protein VIW03_01635 [Anaeromyxobacter sp.]
MKRYAAASLAAALLASCGGPLLFAEVEVPDLRVTLPPQPFPASYTGNPADWCNPASQTNPPCVAVSASYDLAAQVPAFAQSGVTYELRLTDVQFLLSGTQTNPLAPPDLGGIVRATVRVGVDPAVPGSGTVVAAYVRTGTNVHPANIAVSGNANLDLAPYVSTGKLPVRVEVVLDNATSAFDANILAAFYVRITLDWGKYI